jgi:hypothetical protein
MQKLTGISPGQNNKSCRIIHHESKKIGLAFSDFSVIFYAIYKNQPNALHYLRFVLQQGPWKVLNSYICALALRKGPQEDFSPRNRVPGRRPAAVRPNSGEPPAGADRARAGEVPRGTRGRFRARLGREGAGEAGAPAAGRGGRCGRCAGEVGLRRRLGGVGG